VNTWRLGIFKFELGLVQTLRQRLIVLSATAPQPFLQRLEARRFYEYEARIYVPLPYLFYALVCVFVSLLSFSFVERGVLDLRARERGSNLLSPN
jgi:hypothetical protein